MPWLLGNYILGDFTVNQDFILDFIELNRALKKVTLWPVSACFGLSIRPNFAKYICDSPFKEILAWNKVLNESILIVELKLVD